MKEFLVMIGAEVDSDHDTEAEAVSVAKDLLYDFRHAAQSQPWDERAEQITVARTLYTTRKTDIDLDANRCDLQLFPFPDEEERWGIVPPEFKPFATYDGIPCSYIADITHVFAKGIVDAKEGAALRAILDRMPKDRVSAFAIDEVRFYDENTACDDGFIRWRVKGPRVFGTLHVLSEDEVWRDE